jgi:Protein of unknown function (DUF4232)
MHAPAPARRILGLSVAAAAAVTATACSTSTPSGPTATVTITAGSSSAPAPSPSTGASTGSASPAAAPCRTAGLRVSKGATNGAAGTIYTNIDFTNTSGAACMLEGYPGVSLVSAGNNGGKQVGDDAKRTTTAPVRAVTLEAGQTAHAALGVAEAANFPAARCKPVTAHWLKVFPPNQRAAAYVPFTTKTCGNSTVPTMTISALRTGS